MLLGAHCAAISGFLTEIVVVNGAVLVLVGVVGMVFGLACRRYWIALACGFSLILGTVFFGGLFLYLNPRIYFPMGGWQTTWAFPISAALLVNEISAFVLVSVDLNQQKNETRDLNQRFSLGKLFLMVTLFAVSFGAIELFPRDWISTDSVAFGYPWLVALSVSFYLAILAKLISLWGAAYRN